uniref:Uncharacterized protein n=1 Tax=Solanum lycopersicum TaxID=4081 RepID=A0A3Q7IGE7_SOLLC
MSLIRHTQKSSPESLNCVYIYLHTLFLIFTPCPKDQSTTLLKFKKALTPKDPSFTTVVYGDEMTGNVIELDLTFELSHLQRLDFSMNNLSNFHISPNKLRLETHDFKLILRNLTQLKVLGLSYINISSTIPLNFSSHLTTLKLHLNQNNQLMSGYFPKTR